VGHDEYKLFVKMVFNVYQQHTQTPNHCQRPIALPDALRLPFLLLLLLC
jgi:hypothetical protein